MQRTLFDPEDSPSRNLSDSQIDDARQRHPGMLLLFRRDDCYELFDEDAILASGVLGLALTGPKARQVTGFPYQLLEAHLRKLLHLGHRVAICDSEENHA